MLGTFAPPVDVGDGLAPAVEVGDYLAPPVDVDDLAPLVEVKDLAPPVEVGDLAPPVEVRDLCSAAGGWGPCCPATRLRAPVRRQDEFGGRGGSGEHDGDSQGQDSAAVFAAV